MISLRIKTNRCHRERRGMIPQSDDAPLTHNSNSACRRACSRDQKKAGPGTSTVTMSQGAIQSKAIPPWRPFDCNALKMAAAST